MAAGLFTEHKGIVQAHLVGIDDAYRAWSPLKVLLDDVRRWAAQRSNHVLHLGGGRGARLRRPSRRQPGAQPRQTPPVFGLTTELIVGSAPPERAGAASGISETGAELGGALGISILGSIGIAIYRGEVATDLPATVPAEAAATARDTLGAAAGAAQQLPPELGAAVLGVAQQAFIEGMRVTAALTVAVAVAIALFTLVTLRDVRPTGDAGQEASSDEVPATDRREAAERGVPDGRPSSPSPERLTSLWRAHEPAPRWRYRSVHAPYSRRSADR